MSLSEGDLVPIEGKLVRFLREGAMEELGANASIIKVETAVGAYRKYETYYGALARFDDARTLIDEIGVSDELEPQDVEIDLGRWGELVFKALKSQLARELIRPERAHTDGIDVPPRDLQALASLVDDIGTKVGAPGRHERDQSRLERQLARRPLRRSWGHV
jgi:hypothetical protein